jgi:hypothetical protein
MDLCYTLVDEDSPEYEWYSVNDYCVWGGHAHEIVQSVKDGASVFLYLTVSECDEDIYDGIYCAMINNAVTNKAEYYYNLLENQDFYV